MDGNQLMQFVGSFIILRRERFCYLMSLEYLTKFCINLLKQNRFVLVILILCSFILNNNGTHIIETIQFITIKLLYNITFVKIKGKIILLKKKKKKLNCSKK